MVMRWAATVSFICCLGLACAAKQTVVKTVDWQADHDTSWIGRTERQVIDAFGPPTRRAPDGEGGLSLSYERVKSEFMVDDTQLIELGAEPGAATIRAPSLPNERVARDTQEVASFWLGPDGTVRRYWIDPKHTPLKRGPRAQRATRGAVD